MLLFPEIKNRYPKVCDLRTYRIAWTTVMENSRIKIAQSPLWILSKTEL